MITILISNRKGGSAKSTTAINLAAELAKNHNTLLIDLDTQGHASIGIGSNATEEAGIHSIFSGNMLSQTLLPTRLEKLTLSPALSFFEPNEHINDYKILFNCIKNEKLDTFFDYCIIDSAPTYDILLKNALFASDVVIIPVITHPLGVDGAFKMFRAILKSKIELNSNISFVGVLPVMYNPHIKEHQEALLALKNGIGEDKIFEPIGIDIALTRQFFEKEPVVLSQKRTKSATEYKKFTQKLLERIDSVRK